MKLLRKLLLKLTMYDAIWSFPMVVSLFWLVGYIFQSIFGFAAGAYDIAFFQPLFIAVGIAIGAMNSAVAGMWFGVRGLFRFLYGTTAADGRYVNPSKEEFKNLSPWQKFILAFTVLFSYFWAVVFIYLKLV